MRKRLQSVCVIVFGVYLCLSQQLAAHTAGGIRWQDLVEVVPISSAFRTSPRGSASGLSSSEEIPRQTWRDYISPLALEHLASSLWTQIGRASFLTRAGQTWENGSEQLFGPNHNRGSPGGLVVKWAQSGSPLKQQPIKTFQT